MHLYCSFVYGSEGGVFFWGYRSGGLDSHRQQVGGVHLLVSIVRLEKE